MQGLILDTSIDIISIILAENEKIKRVISTQNSDKSLFIFSYLKKIKLNLNKLSFLGVSTGPGSYTSIRVGAAITKAFSFAKNIPLIGYSHLMGYVPPEEGPFLAVLDAKTRGFYVIEGTKKNKKIEYSKGPFLCSVSELLQYSDTLILSPDFENIKKRTASKIKHLKYSLPSPERITELVFKKLTKKKQDLDLLYLT